MASLGLSLPSPGQLLDPKSLHTALSKLNPKQNLKLSQKCYQNGTQNWQGLTQERGQERPRRGHEPKRVRSMPQQPPREPQESPKRSPKRAPRKPKKTQKHRTRTTTNLCDPSKTLLTDSNIKKLQSVCEPSCWRVGGGSEKGSVLESFWVSQGSPKMPTSAAKGPRRTSATLAKHA